MSESARVEELLRINAELAAEVRNLTLGFGDAPRPAGMLTSRRIGRLIEERDGAEAELATTRAELEGAKEHVAELEAARADLERQLQELGQEVIRLRAGWKGLARRLRARLLSR